MGTSRFPPLPLEYRAATLFQTRRTGDPSDVEDAKRQQLSMLTILHAACSTALDTFYAADNPVDLGLVADLEKMVERTRVEIEALTKAT